MLNKNNERELAYVVRVEEIRPLEGYDRVEYARIGAGWWVVVSKGDFTPGSLGIYFEIDSKVPDKEPFIFLANRNYKIKTQKMCKVVSQGLLMPPKSFGWEVSDGVIHDGKITYSEGDFLTSRLGVTYSSEEDNSRKGGDKSINESSIKAKHKKFFRNPIVKKLMKYKFFRTIFIKMFKPVKPSSKGFPDWVVKTDEERCQNLSYLFPGNDEKWISTEKIDGTSTTFTMKNSRKNANKNEMVVCSRGVAFRASNDKELDYYDRFPSNIYTEMAKKYDMRSVLINLIDYVASKNPKGKVDFVTIQGETYGNKVQKRTYGCKEGVRHLAVFNVIYSVNGEVTRLNPIEMFNCIECIRSKFETERLNTVPIINTEFKIPETCDELLKIATGNSIVDGGMREGLVFRSEDGKRSFKAVSNEYLLKYHG